MILKDDFNLKEKTSVISMIKIIMIDSQKIMTQRRRSKKLQMQGARSFRNEAYCAVRCND